MKALPTLIRICKWKLEEMRRKQSELEGLRKDLESQLQKLKLQHVEEQRLAESSVEYATTYNGYANLFVTRREKLNQSIGEVDEAIEISRIEVEDAFQEVKKYEIVHNRNTRREVENTLRSEQVSLDETGAQAHRAKVA